MAGSFCLLAENGLAGLPALTLVSPPDWAKAGVAHAAPASTTAVKARSIPRLVKSSLPWMWIRVGRAPGHCGTLVRKLLLAVGEPLRDLAVRVALQEVLGVDADEQAARGGDDLAVLAQLGEQPELAAVDALGGRGDLVAPADEARAHVVDLEPAGHRRPAEGHEQATARG